MISLTPQEEVKIRDKESALLDSFHQFSLYKKLALERFENSLKMEEEKWKQQTEFLSSSEVSRFSAIFKPNSFYYLFPFHPEVKIILSENARNDTIFYAIKNYQMVDLSKVSLFSGWLKRPPTTDFLSCLTLNGKDLKTPPDVALLIKFVEAAKSLKEIHLKNDCELESLSNVLLSLYIFTPKKVYFHLFCPKIKKDEIILSFAVPESKFVHFRELEKEKIYWASPKGVLDNKHFLWVLDDFSPWKTKSYTIRVAKVDNLLYFIGEFPCDFHLLPLSRKKFSKMETSLKSNYIQTHNLFPCSHQKFYLWEMKIGESGYVFDSSLMYDEKGSTLVTTKTSKTTTTTPTTTIRRRFFAQSCLVVIATNKFPNQPVKISRKSNDSFLAEMTQSIYEERYKKSKDQSMNGTEESFLLVTEF